MAQLQNQVTDAREREISGAVGTIGVGLDNLDGRLAALLVRLRGSQPEKMPPAPTPIATSVQSELAQARRTLDSCGERMNEIDGLI